MSIMNKNPGIYQDDMIPNYGRKKNRSVQADINKKNFKVSDNDVNDDVDKDYLLDCLKITPEERFIRCTEFSEFNARLNQYIQIELAHDHPDIYELK